MFSIQNSLESEPAAGEKARLRRQWQRQKSWNSPGRKKEAESGVKRSQSILGTLVEDTDDYTPRGPTIPLCRLLQQGTQEQNTSFPRRIGLAPVGFGIDIYKLATVCGESRLQLISYIHTYTVYSVTSPFTLARCRPRKIRSR